MADAVGLGVIVYFCVTSVNTTDNNTLKTVNIVFNTHVNQDYFKGKCYVVWQMLYINSKIIICFKQSLTFDYDFKQYYTLKLCMLNLFNRYLIDFNMDLISCMWNTIK